MTNCKTVHYVLKCTELSTVDCSFANLLFLVWIIFKFCCKIRRLTYLVVVAPFTEMVANVKSSVKIKDYITSAKKNLCSIQLQATHLEKYQICLTDSNNQSKMKPFAYFIHCTCNNFTQISHALHSSY